MSAHTPGPWDFVLSGDGGWEIYGDLQPPPIGASGVLCSRAAWPHRREESEANGRIMGAALDMLHALELAAPHHQGAHSKVGKAIRAALAKAKEGSP